MSCNSVNRSPFLICYFLIELKSNVIGTDFRGWLVTGGLTIRRNRWASNWGGLVSGRASTESRSADQMIVFLGISHSFVIVYLKQLQGYVRVLKLCLFLAA